MAIRHGSISVLMLEKRSPYIQVTSYIGGSKDMIKPACGWNMNGSVVKFRVQIPKFGINLRCLALEFLRSFSEAGVYAFCAKGYNEGFT